MRNALCSGRPRTAGLNATRDAAPNDGFRVVIFVAFGCLKRLDQSGECVGVASDRPGCCGSLLRRSSILGRSEASCTYYESLTTELVVLGHKVLAVSQAGLSRL
jgi:hypothetical protein